MAKARIMETIIAIAGEISPTLGKTINSVNKQLGGINDIAIAAGAAVAGIGKAAVDATKYLNKLGTEYQQAVNSVAASTGAAGKELDGLKDTIKEVYKSNFGESMQDVADAVSIVQRNTKLAGDELTNVTKGAFALSDTFGYDVAESSRAAKAMMTNFGISGEDAMSMIAAGAQNGLDFSGELIDSINEYSVQFAKLGFSADDMFNIFQKGADSGAWNLDKVGDAIKEFSIRSIDGSKTTTNAFKDLGLNSDKMMATFAKGGNEAEYAFQIVVDKLIGMKDQVERDAVGVALFGTMWEDLGIDAVKAMAKTNGSAYDTQKALEGINKVKYDDLGSAMEGIKRKAEVALMPAAESVTNAFMDQVPKLEGLIDEITPYVAQFAEKIGPAITATFDGLEKGIGWLIDNKEAVIPAIAGIGAAFATWKLGSMVKDAGGFVGILGKAKGALGKLGGALSFFTSPLGIATLAIGAAVAAVVWLYRNWDTAKEKVLQFGQKVGEIWGKISGWIGNAIESIGQKFPIFGGYLSGWWKSIQDVVENVKNIFHGVIDFISNVFAGNWKGAWDNIVEIFGNVFAGIGNLTKAPLNGIIGVVNAVIDKINGAGFTIPDWVPGVGGKSFSINVPKIPMLATGGFTDGVSIAGEAGREAVISFDPRYRSDNLSYWAQAGRMLGVDPSYSLSGAAGGTYIDLGGVNFSPKIEVKGDAKKSDIMEAIRAVYPEFLDMLDELIAEREEAVYA